MGCGFLKATTCTKFNAQVRLMLWEKDMGLCSAQAAAEQEAKKAAADLARLGDFFGEGSDALRYWGMATPSCSKLGG